MHIVDKDMNCFINIKILDGTSDFTYTFDNGLKKRLSPSQEKQNLARKEEYKRIKLETESYDQAKEVEAVNAKKDRKCKAVEKCWRRLFPNIVGIYQGISSGSRMKVNGIL